MDIRIEKTRQSIINAFIELRSHKELERITIKELCEKAQINKSTFYAHYQDIYHLSDTLETEVVVSIMENLTHPERVLDDTAFFSRELFMGFLAKDSLIGILFSGSRSKCLVQKIEVALKELVFRAYPQYREDKDINIMLTYILYGCYYAFYENRKYGDVPVLSSITELTGKTAQAAVKIPTDEISFHIRKGGKGGGFGKYGEEDGVLDSDWELRVKGSDLVDFPVSSGASDEWFYIKFRSGLAMMWCNVTTKYSAASVLEKWVSYPFALQAGVVAFGTLEGVGSNAGAALGWNVKIVPQSDNKNARVFVHNPSGSFGGADAVTVSVLVLGCYKQVAQAQIVGTATVGSVITAERLNEIEERNYSTDSKITAVKEALN